ncbi:hypothetical protein AURDEDRAFT_160418 [Auricularia subglabra TFB-10046 SS5]|nr:hypothetical protein AURDEDRAFT_160418 [Auricularia subglabra TFB-10046 SS5]
MACPMHTLDPLWNPRSPPESYSDVDGDNPPELPDILDRLRKTRNREPPHLKMPVRGPMTLRQALQVNCFVQTGGVVAREFQLDVGKAVHDNQDIIVLAFTGSGKSLPMGDLLNRAHIDIIAVEHRRLL